MPEAALVYTDEEDRHMHTRMINWGKAMRDRRTGHGYPKLVPGMAHPDNNGTVDELDADAIEEVLSAFRVANIGKSAVHAFLAKIEYLERAEHRMNSASERAKDVANKYGLPCSERTYYRMLWEMRKAVWAML